jgi:SAM-dependent methyltransferase
MTQAEKWSAAVDSLASNSPQEFWSRFDEPGTDLNEQLVRGQWDMALQVLRDPVPGYLKRTSDKTALDIGYGGGRVLAAASRYFEFVYGVDVHNSSALVEKMLVENGIHNYKLFTTDGSSIPLEGETIDFVYSFIVMMHFEDHTVFERYISEIARVLRPGAVAQIFFGRPFGWRTWLLPTWLQPLAFSLESLPERLICDALWKGYREIPADSTATTLMVSYRKAKDIALKNGLKVVGTGPSYYRLPDRYPHLGTQRFVCLTKV